MKHLCHFAGAVLLLTGLFIALPRPAQTIAPATPTFTKDVAPILFKHCASCHRPGDIAPMSLLTYEDARPWAKAIREQVASGQMPPWHAVGAHGTFANDRRLSKSEKDTVLRWVNGGAPKGDPKDLPPAPKFTDGWEIGTPDAVINMPKEYEVPANFDLLTGITSTGSVNVVSRTGGNEFHGGLSRVAA